MKTNAVIAVCAFCGLCACARERAAPDAAQAVGVMQVEVEEHGSESVDRIETIRFIVFTDMASEPRAEINRRYGAEDFVTDDPAAAASRVGIVLEVARRARGPNDKLVVAIANEPPAMTGTLDAVTTPGQLEGLELPMSHFVTDDHLSLRPDVPMPMSGAAWTDDGDLYPEAEQAAAHRVRIVLSRVVARVEVWLNADPAEGLAIARGSAVTLENSSVSGYFIRHRDDAGHVLGHIRTAAPDDLVRRSWTLTAEQMEVPHGEPVHVCTFYTPERRCGADQPGLTFGIVTTDGAARGGTFTLDRAVEHATQVERTIDVIRRNSTYRVRATVGENGITAVVNDWNNEEITVEM